MTAKIISGTETPKAIREELKIEVDELRDKHNITPGLVTILVGEDPASQSYVAAKNKTAHALGIHSEQVTLAADTSEKELLELVDKYNNDPKIHGILVQLPLPKHINEGKVLFAIDPDKDVDGFHPVNVGKMMVGEQCFLPCTPHGVLELLQRSGTETSGAEVLLLADLILSANLLQTSCCKNVLVAMLPSLFVIPAQKIWIFILSVLIF